MGRVGTFLKGWGIFFFILVLVFVVYGITILAKGVDKVHDSVPEILTSDAGNVYVFELKKDPFGKGKNKVVFPETVSVRTAKDLLLAIPSADAVSYFDEQLNETVGYVSAFGGIGKNFPIVPGREYEVSVRKDARWSVVAG